MKKIVGPVCCVALLLTACDNKEILPGKRELIAGITEVDKHTKSVVNSNVKIYPTAATVISSHIDVAGNKQHNSVNYQMSESPKLLWKRSLAGGQVHSDPIAFDNRIFVVNSLGDLICISQDTGAQLWKINIAKQPDDALFSGGLTANGHVIYASTNIGNVVAVDTKSQKIIWTKSLRFPLKGSPLFVTGIVVVNSIEGQTFVLNAADGSLVWSKTTTAEPTIMSESATPAVYGSSLICAYSSGDLKSLDINSGNDIWGEILFSTNTSDSGSAMSHIVASPAIHNGMILAVTSESKMVMFDAADGVKVWEKDIGTVNTPVINNGWVFVLTNDKSIVCLSEKDGAVKWTTDIRELYADKLPKYTEFVGPLLINGNVVVFGSNGDILKLDISTGAQKCIEKIDGMRTSRTPIIVGKKLFAVTDRAELYAIG